MRTHTRPSPIPSISLALSAVAFAVPGVAFLLRPDLLAIAGVEVAGPAGFTELRALYGGLELGLAAFFAMAWRRERWHRPALVLQVLAFAGLFLGRAYGLLVDGGAERLTVILMSLEALGLVVGVVALRAAARPPEDDRGDR
jgi:hypothetical protein